MTAPFTLLVLAFVSEDTAKRWWHELLDFSEPRKILRQKIGYRIWEDWEFYLCLDGRR